MEYLLSLNLFLQFANEDGVLNTIKILLRQASVEFENLDANVKSMFLTFITRHKSHVIKFLIEENIQYGFNFDKLMENEFGDGGDKQKQKQTPLQLAAKYSSSDVILMFKHKRLQKYSTKWINKRDNQGRTPLCECAMSMQDYDKSHQLTCEKYESFCQLLEHENIDVNICDDNGFSAIFYYIRADEKEYLHLISRSKSSNDNNNAANQDAAKEADEREANNNVKISVVVEGHDKDSGGNVVDRSSDSDNDDDAPGAAKKSRFRMNSYCSIVSFSTASEEEAVMHWRLDDINKLHTNEDKNILMCAARGSSHVTLEYLVETKNIFSQICGQTKAETESAAKFEIGPFYLNEGKQPSKNVDTNVDDDNDDGSNNNKENDGFEDDGGDVDGVDDADMNGDPDFDDEDDDWIWK